MEKHNKNKNAIAKYVSGICALLFLFFALLCITLLLVCAVIINNRQMPPMPQMQNSVLPQEPQEGFYKPDKIVELQKEPLENGALTNSAIYRGAVESVVDIMLLYKDAPQWQSAGTGIIISDDGMIVTSSYLLAGAEYCKVVLQSGEELTAIMVAADNYSGLAVISVEPTQKLTAATFADTDALQIGDKVLSIGVAGRAFSGSLSEGMISGLSRDVEVNTDGGIVHLSGLIQVDRALAGGNYGCALLNIYGQVIGISTPYGEWEGGTVGFAIPSSRIKQATDFIITLGYVPRAALGVTAEEISDAECAAFRLPTNGVMINSISEKCGLSKYGIRPGDFIFAIDNVEVNSTKELVREVQKHQEGDSVSVLICNMETLETQEYKVVLLGNSK
ncbi:MAG: trypsin-like peptidase domain-containing protein [Oscillospiraceae bacterium]